MLSLFIQLSSHLNKEQHLWVPTYLPTYRYHIWWVTRTRLRYPSIKISISTSLFIHNLRETTSSSPSPFFWSPKPSKLIYLFHSPAQMNPIASFLDKHPKHPHSSQNRTGQDRKERNTNPESNPIHNVVTIPLFTCSGSFVPIVYLDIECEISRGRERERKIKNSIK